MRSTAAVLSAFLAITSAATTVSGAESVRTERERYTECMTLAHQEPAKGLERARTWHDTGGGDAARHCAGVALISLGRYAEAGRHLEALAKTMDRRHGAGMRADALAQAGQAWLLAGKPARAEAAYTQALDLRTDDVELWIDRALARFEMTRYWEAIDDLNRASELAPDRADVLVYRASAYRHVDAPAMARNDVREALGHAPYHPEGLLERGILRRMNDNPEGARRDWLKVIDVAPASAAADAARANIARLDVKGAGPRPDDS